MGLVLQMMSSDTIEILHESGEDNELMSEIHSNIENNRC